MKPLAEYLAQSSIEDEIINSIYDSLKEVCTQAEFNSIERNKEFKTSGRKTIIDLYLAKGIKKLEWPENTIVELKYTLNLNSLQTAASNFKRIKDKYKYEINQFTIIYYTSIFAFPPSYNHENPNIKLISLQELSYICKEKSERSDSENNKSTENIKTPDSKPIVPETISISDWKEEREERLSLLKENLNNDLTSLFLGAGVSASANMPSWGKLLEQMLTQHSKKSAPNYFPCDLKNVLHYCGDSYIIAARYINFTIDAKTRAKIIQDSLYKNPQKSDLIESICNLIKVRNVYQVITTNYDQLIEIELKRIGVNPFPVASCSVVTKNSTPVYHVHGSVNDPNNQIQNDIPDAPVLSEEDYHNLYATGHHWSNTAILHALQHTHCIFIGLSMTDPNLRRLIESAYHNDSPHYVFMPRVPLYEGYYENDMRNIFHYKVQENIMKSLGINVIWYNLNPKSQNAHEELYSLINSLAK